LSANDQYEPAIEALSDWNAAIALWFFPELLGSARVRLAVDDETVEEIRQQFGLSASLERAVLDVLGPNVQDPDDFNLVRTRLERANGVDKKSPWYLALLAMQVLAASRMVGDNAFTAGNFWDRFGALFEMEKAPKENLRKLFTDLWKRLNNYLEFVCGSTRGTLALPSDPDNIPYHGRSNINYPISQVLVRRADRIPLQDLFERTDLCDLSDDQLVERLSSEAGLQAELSLPLRHVLQQARKETEAGGKSNLQSAVAEIFHEIRKGDASIPERLNRTGPSRIAQRYATRIHLIRDDLTDELHLEAHLFKEGDEVAVREKVPLAEFLRGFHWDIGAARWRARDVGAFVLSEGSWQTGVHKLSDENTPIAVLLQDSEAPAFLARVSESEGVQITKLAGELSGGCLVSFKPGRLWGTALFDELNIRCAGGRPSLIGGLRFNFGNGISSYVRSAPPSLWMPGPARWKVSCRLASGLTIESFVDVTPVETPTSLRVIVGDEHVEAGRYVVTWTRADVQDFTPVEQTFKLCDSICDARAVSGDAQVAYVIAPLKDVSRSILVSKTSAAVIGLGAALDIMQQP
jgi:hypothetical protein